MIMFDYKWLTSITIRLIATRPFHAFRLAMLFALLLLVVVDLLRCCRAALSIVVLIISEFHLDVQWLG